MSKIQLLIIEHQETDFKTKTLIEIKGDSLVEILAKLPLQIDKLYDQTLKEMKAQIERITDDDIPF